MNVTRRGQTSLLIGTASILSLFACSNDSNDISENRRAETGLDEALSTISRENIQSSLNYLAADEREGRMTGVGVGDSATS